MILFVKKPEKYHRSIIKSGDAYRFYDTSMILFCKNIRKSHFYISLYINSLQEYFHQIMRL